MAQEAYYDRPGGREPQRPQNGGRRPAPQGQREPPRRKKRRRGMGALRALLYVAFVLRASALLAGLGWTWACDVLALNKAEHTAVITLPGDIFTDQERDVEKTGADGEKLTVTETVPTADMDYVADLIQEPVGHVDSVRLLDQVLPDPIFHQFFYIFKRHMLHLLYPPRKIPPYGPHVFRTLFGCSPYIVSYQQQCR